MTNTVKANMRLLTMVRKRRLFTYKYKTWQWNMDDISFNRMSWQWMNQSLTFNTGPKHSTDSLPPQYCTMATDGCWLCRSAKPPLCACMLWLLATDLANLGLLLKYKPQKIFQVTTIATNSIFAVQIINIGV